MSIPVPRRWSVRKGTERGLGTWMSENPRGKAVSAPAEGSLANGDVRGRSVLAESSALAGQCSTGSGTGIPSQYSKALAGGDFGAGSHSGRGF